MYQRRRLKRSKNYLPPRGIRKPRLRRFQPTLETKSGTLVRSTYERRCADLLTKNDIEFQYEPLMLLGGHQFRPDFYLPIHNLFIEICGYSHMPHYRRRMSEKMNVYKKYDLKAVFIHYSGRGSLETIISDKLSAAGITLQL